MQRDEVSCPTKHVQLLIQDSRAEFPLSPAPCFSQCITPVTANDCYLLLLIAIASPVHSRSLPSLGVDEGFSITIYLLIEHIQRLK